MIEFLCALFLLGLIACCLVHLHDWWTARRKPPPAPPPPDPLWVARQEADLALMREKIIETRLQCRYLRQRIRQNKGWS